MARATRGIAWLTRGARRLRYRGRAAKEHWLHNRVAGLDLRRLLTLGLHRTPAGWAIT